MNAKLPSLEQMLTRLIATPSVSSTDPLLDNGNAVISEILAGWLESIGFTVELLPVPGHASKLNVVARRGPSNAALVFAGHSDTVPYDDGCWTRDPFAAERTDERLYGLGSADMKSFFALVLEALRDTTPGKQSAGVVVVATADEESGMAGARELVNKHTILAPNVLIGEPTRLQPVRAHKGIFMLRIVLTGQSGHSSDPALGRNALEGMHAVIDSLYQLRQQFASQYRDSRFMVPVPTLNLGRIMGGDNPNRICARCELDIDVRLTPGLELEPARRLVQDACLDAVKERGLDVEFLSLFDGVAALDTPGDSPLIRAAETATGCAAGVVSFATEAPLFAELGAQSVVLGPGDIDVAHQPDEYLALASIAPMIGHIRRLYRHFCEAAA